MSLPPILLDRLRLPVVAAPLFLVSNPELVIAQCKGGVIGSFPALNARPQEELERWLARIEAELSDYDRIHAPRPAAPFAVNQIVHRSNQRLERDLEVCVRHRVPIVITSLGARREVNDAVHAYGGVTLHDVINNSFARKAIEKGADGLIAVAAGAGGHAGVQSPFALIQEIRQWFDGPLLLSGAIAGGRSIIAAQAMGADLAYIGSPFIATHEANASAKYKQMIVDSTAQDIVYSDFFTGVHGNYLRPSIVANGLDPDGLPASRAANLDLSKLQSSPKAWKDVWGCGQGVGAVDRVVATAELIRRLGEEYVAGLQQIEDATNDWRRKLSV